MLTCEAAEYCRYIDILWICLISLIYGAGVLIVGFAEHRMKERKHAKLQSRRGVSKIMGRD